MANETPKNILKWSSTAIGIIPGFTILLTNLGVIPGYNKINLGAIVEATGAFIIIYIWFKKDELIKRKKEAIARISLVCFILFALLCLSYFLLYDKSYIPAGRRTEPVAQPLWVNKELNAFLTKDIETPTLESYFDKYGPRNTEEKINTYSFNSMIITKTIIYLNFIGIFSMLTIAFSGIWLRLEADKIL
jgi:hypothetical protein